MWKVIQKTQKYRTNKTEKQKGVSVWNKFLLFELG